LHRLLDDKPHVQRHFLGKRMRRVKCYRACLGLLGAEPVDGRSTWWHFDGKREDPQIAVAGNRWFTQYGTQRISRVRVGDLSQQDLAVHYALWKSALDPR
jgi:hypothetical protein